MIKITLTAESGITVGGLDLFKAGETSISGEVNLKTKGNNRYSFCQMYYEDDFGKVDKSRPIPSSSINIPYGYDFLAKTKNEAGEWVDTYEEVRGVFEGVDGDIYNSCNIHIQLLEASNPALKDQVTITGI